MAQAIPIPATPPVDIFELDLLVGWLVELADELIVALRDELIGELVEVAMELVKVDDEEAAG
jgi:hypothetical protein